MGKKRSNVAIIDTVEQDKLRAEFRTLVIEGDKTWAENSRLEGERSEWRLKGWASRHPGDTYCRDRVSALCKRAGRLLEKLTGEKRTTPMELWLDWVFVHAKDFVDLIATPAEPSAPTAIYQSINRLAEASELAIDALPLVKRPRGAAQRSGRKGKYFKRREHKQWSDMYANGKWPTYTELADHLKKNESAVRKGIQKYRWTTLKAESSKRR